jgi:anti-sigma factor RsiW
MTAPWPPVCPYRISIASYVLGALPPEERRELDTHVRACAECHAELVGLAGLPGLLARLRRQRRKASGLPP